MPLLFSYGTLQDVRVQLATFGRRMASQPDALAGFELTTVQVGVDRHANLVPSDKAGAAVSGLALDVADRELAAADRYERTASYSRIEVVLASGQVAWVYVYDPTPPP